MPRSVLGYIYVADVYGIAKPKMAFKLDGYIYVRPLSSDRKQVYYRYHEDSTCDRIAFQAAKHYWYLF